MSIIYLEVPFKDKEIVKVLGARWDGKAKLWFVPKESESRFARWVKKSPAFLNETGSLEESKYFAKIEEVRVDGVVVAASLSSLLFEVSEAVRRAIPESRWVRAEVASFRTHPHSGHSYLELVEHDENGRELAKASGRIWSGNARIIKKFEKEAGGSLSEGMKVMIKVSADFSIQYGFGLTIDDIDAAWTVGEMQKKIGQIREQLIEENVFQLNKKLSRSEDFCRVALVAPDGAAGLGDFMSDANRLVLAGLCKFDIYSAVFEGAGAKISLVSALSSAISFASANAYDAVVIVRGGGAKTSLNWVNEYEVARLICLSDVPVMVGIGHERDETILDEVACESFDTPSKVIGAIWGRIVGNVNDAILSMEQVSNGVRDACAQSHREVVELVTSSAREARRNASREMQRIKLIASDTMANSRADLLKSKDEVQMLVREVVGLGPKASLSRGYSIVSKNGRSIGRIENVAKGDELMIKMADGELPVKVIQDGEIKGENYE